MFKYELCGKFLSEGNWQHMNRIMDANELILMTDGEMYICEDDIKYIISPGDLLFLRKGHRHFGYKKSDSYVSFYWVHFQEENEMTDFPTHVHFSNSSHINELFKQLLHFSSYSNEDAQCAFILLIHEVIRTLKENGKLHTSLAENICSWIDIHLHMDITVGQIANVFGFNRDYISRIIKREKGMSIQKYIIMQRINKAKVALINTNQSVKEIYAKCGFRDYKQFLKLFKHYEGITPTQYRNVRYGTNFNIV